MATGSVPPPNTHEQYTLPDGKVSLSACVFRSPPVIDIKSDARCSQTQHDSAGLRACARANLGRRHGCFELMQQIKICVHLKNIR